jgi:NAD(P) transhydrogenase subunit alpha
MKAGSVIVDLAASHGGNCELSQPNKLLKAGEVTIIGNSNLAGLIPTTASELYANNLMQLINLLLNKESALAFNAEDEIIQQSLLCHEGRYLPFKLPSEAQ